MKRPTFAVDALACFLTIVGSATKVIADDPGRAVVAVKVEKRTDVTFALLRGGSPYFIKGAGGSQHLDTLKRSGGNSLRVWGADHLAPLLNEANGLGLTVSVGIWLGHPRHGFRYDDEAAVRRQFDSTRAVIRQFKNHPAVLIWSLGNEMEGDGQDPRVWRAVNDLAKMAKLEDPNHPTMTVIAELGPENSKLAMFREHCPDVDILGVNSYNGATSLGERLAKARFDRPFILTEFGPRGFWEGPKTSWKAPIEPTSTEKAETYRISYAKGVAANAGRCVGSYAFLWGNKQEVTSTWFGLFLPSGEKTEGVDVLVKAWTGEAPKNRCPRIVQAKFDDARMPIAPGSEHQATISVADPDGHPLTIGWEVRPESGSHHEGGDRESEPAAIADLIEVAQGDTVRLRAPKTPGPYRLFVVVRDGLGGSATANFPFLVAP